MKLRFYHWMVVVGGFLSLAMLLDLFDIPAWASTVCAWLSMLGGGVLCSALVSWSFEKQNQQREQKQKNAQKEYLLKSVKDGFQRLCEREFFMLSCFWTTHIQNEGYKLRRETFALKTVGQNICDLLTKIEKHEENKRNSDEIIVITLESMKFDEIKKKQLASGNMVYYNSMLQSLTELLDEAPLFLSSGIFSNTDIENLKSIRGDIQDVISFSSDYELEDGTLIAFKKILFEKTEEIMTMLDIPADTQISCQYR